MANVPKITLLTGLTEPDNKKEVDVIPFHEFLMKTPPQTPKKVSEFFGNGEVTLITPINIHCNSDLCDKKGKLLFRYLKEGDVNHEDIYYKIILYRCSHCMVNTKSYAILYVNDDLVDVYCVKLGEYPNFGQPLPSKLINMVGPDRELFLKGRRCEIQGLGIASFAYYRRVIEDQKVRLFDEIIKVTKLLEPESPLIEELQKAKNETQFTKSMKDIKTALPQILLIKGENPLSLLHSALSDGLHAKSDEECLEDASSIRLVLTELAGKITAALKDDLELAEAVKNLKKLKSSKASQAG